MTSTSRSTAPRVVVTGPTGWVGTAVVDHLARRLGRTWRGSVTLLASRERVWTAPDGAPAAVRDLRSVTPADVDGALVLHLAHLGRERAADIGATEFARTDADVDATLLAAMSAGRPRAVFVSSSGAAARAEQGADGHPYALAKLRQERELLGYAADSGVPVLVGRIWSLGGTWANKVEHYALGSFATQALAGGPVTVRATAPVMRSYLHVDDLAALVLDALLAAGPATGPAAVPTHPVDLCGERVVEVGELAAAVAVAAERLTGRQVRVSRPALRDGPPDRYTGDPAWTLDLARRSGRTLACLEQQVADTLAWLAGPHPEPTPTATVGRSAPSARREP